ncbi:MAG TPA: type II toxin-antitoxin system prevent-host-death family antitoxin [Sphingobium sp.]|nr:type II toxin-antitoxin system prevent-host-death family antitoxin [Sphingobium sp.]
MRHVAVSEFKDKASELIAAAERGEEIVITRHGRPAVRLVPVEGGFDMAKRVAALEGFRQLREQMRARGQSVSVEEAIAWKNEGRP